MVPLKLKPLREKKKKLMQEEMVNGSDVESVNKENGGGRLILILLGKSTTQRNLPFTHQILKPTSR